MQPLTTRERLFCDGVPLLAAVSVQEKNARSMLAGLDKRHGDEPVAQALQARALAKPIEPMSWLQARLNGPPKAPGRVPTVDTAARNDEAMKLLGISKNTEVMSHA